MAEVRPPNEEILRFSKWVDGLQKAVGVLKERRKECETIGSRKAFNELAKEFNEAYLKISATKLTHINSQISDYNASLSQGEVALQKLKLPKEIKLFDVQSKPSSSKAKPVMKALARYLALFSVLEGDLISAQPTNALAPVNRDSFSSRERLSSPTQIREAPMASPLLPSARELGSMDLSSPPSVNGALLAVQAEHVGVYVYPQDYNPGNVSVAKDIAQAFETDKMYSSPIFLVSLLMISLSR